MNNDNVYLYTKIKQQLIEYIKDLPINSRIPTRTELVKKFGVTRTTIERAISELIGEGYFYSRIGSGTYLIKKEKGSSLNKKSSWGIIMPNITTDTYPEIIRAVEDVCSEAGINLIICNSDNNIEKQEKYITQLVESGVTGIVMVPVIEKPLENKSFDILIEKDVKFVFCNRGVDGINAPRVVSNDFYGGNIATRHLFINGWIRPAYISRPFYSISERRYNGYLNAVYDYGTLLNENYVRFESDFDIENSGYEVMKQLLELPEPPDSVFCFNDAVAVGAYRAIEEKGKKVGRDIGVIGYDDTHICESLRPKLTSVRYPKYEIGRRAADILLRMTRNEVLKENFCSMVFQPELIIRESCGEDRKPQNN